MEVEERLCLHPTVQWSLGGVSWAVFMVLPGLFATLSHAWSLTRLGRNLISRSIDWLIYRIKYLQLCLFSFTHFNVNSNLCYYWRIVFHSKISVVNITGVFTQDGVLRTRSAYFFHFFVSRMGAGLKTAKNNWHGKSLGATTRRSHADVLVNELQRRGRQVYSYRDARDILRCQHIPPHHVEAAHAAC